MVNTKRTEGERGSGVFLIYGSYGFTGELIVEHALSRGLRPILAGRNANALARQAEPAGLEHRAFTLEDTFAARSALADVDVALHCAGPFASTFQSMVDHCLATGTHYTDITGEIEVFEALARRHDAARAAGIVVMGGVGFDVVPTDCLAAHLARRLPTATHLTLAFRAVGTAGTSRGTQRTMVENVGSGGTVRRDGKLVSVPAAFRHRTIDFGLGPQRAITIPWGDVSTAFHSTGIPNIEVYLGASLGLHAGARATRVLAPLLRTRLAQRAMLGAVARRRPGPTDHARDTSALLVWGQAHDDAGNYVTSTMRTPEGYTATARTAVAVIERLLAGGVEPGFHTPSMAFGPDFVLDIGGVTRTDVA